MRNRLSVTRRRLLAGCGGLPFLFSARAGWATETVSSHIVSLSWAGVQMLLELGITPVAISDKTEYISSGCRPLLPPHVGDVGLNSQPDIDALMQFAPQLLIIDAGEQAIADRLSGFAPIFMVDIYGPGDVQPYLRAQQETLRLAKLLNVVPRAQQRIAWLDTYLDVIRLRLSRLKLPPLVIADLDQDGLHLWIYGGNSMLQNVLTRLGLQNGWQGPFGDSGYSPLLSIEQLASLDNVLFLYINRPGKNPIQALNLSPVWQQLPFVKRKQVLPLNSFFAMGALSCAQQFAEELLGALEPSEVAHVGS